MSVSNNDAALGEYPADHPRPADYEHPLPWDMPLDTLTMTALFARSVREFGARDLLDFYGRTFTYAEVQAEAARFAAGLQARGIARGDRIGLFLPNVPTYVAAYYGAMMAGATVVNFSPLYTAEELAAQVEDSGAQLMVTVDVPALLPTALEVLEASSLQTLVVGQLANQLPRLKGWAMRLFKRSDIAPIPSRSDVIKWPDILASSPPSPVKLDPHGDLALLQYTGGTTGRPKGAMLSHANLATNALQVDAIDPFDDARDMIVGVLPLFHVFANTCVLNRTIVNGGCIAMLPRFDAGQTLKTIDRVKPSALPGVPTMYQALLDHPRIAQTDFSSLLICISGGAPLPAPVREKFEEVSGARLVEGYGLTESSGVVSVNPYKGKRHPGTIGQVVPGTRVRLLDKEDPGKLAAPGEPGELVINGPQIMGGYWNRPDAAAHAFAEIDGERWLRTGDIAVIDGEGFISIVDRSKDMIAVGGFKVFPSQVEAVLVEHEAIKEALVIGVPDDYLGERPKAYVTLNEGAGASGEELTEWLNSRIGKHERVAGVEIRADLPKTMIGKLDRKALRAEVLGD